MIKGSFCLFLDMVAPHVPKVFSCVNETMVEFNVGNNIGLSTEPAQTYYKRLSRFYEALAHHSKIHSGLQKNDTYLYTPFFSKSTKVKFLVQYVT